MAWRFRKSIGIVPGLRLNLGKRSAGVRIGGRRGGVSVNSSGRKSISAPLGGGFGIFKSWGGGREADPEMAEMQADALLDGEEVATKGSVNENGIVEMACPLCDTPILFAQGAAEATCDNCSAKFDLTTNP